MNDDDRNADEISGLEGLVETLSARGAQGWVWLPKTPSARLDIDVLVDRRILYTVRADQHRTDLYDAGIGDGAHGFSVRFLPGMVDPNSDISFFAKDANIAIRIDANARRTGPYEGSVEFVTQQEIRGWVWHPDDPATQLSVAAIEGQRVVGEVMVNQFRKDLAEKGIGSGRHGFIIRPFPSNNWNPGEVAVYVKGTAFKVPTLQVLDVSTPKAWNNRPEFRSYDPPTAGSQSTPDSMSVDIDYYQHRNSDIDFSTTDPETHFGQIGWKEGRSPNREFSTIYYLAHHEDVLTAEINPLTHFCVDGYREGRHIAQAPPVDEERKFRLSLRKIQSDFDVTYYNMQVPRLNLSAMTAIIHYSLFGSKLGRNPNAYFSLRYYLAAYPDVAVSDIEPFLHFIIFGREEGRQPNESIRNVVQAEFDSENYELQSPDLKGYKPVEHYVAFGWRQGLNPTKWFDVDYYLRLSPDVRDAGIEPFSHFIQMGRTENRATSPSSKPGRAMPVERACKTILFVGHDGIHSGAQVVLLEIVRWFANHTRYPLKVLLLGLGSLTRDYAQLAPTFVMHRDYADFRYKDELVEFLTGEYLVCYVNTVASGRFAHLYDQFPNISTVPIILHVHEMEGVIREHSHSFDCLRPRVTSYIAVSEAIKSTLTRSFAISSNRIFVSNAFIKPTVESLHDIISLRQTTREGLGVSTSSFVVMGAGTVYPRKGPDLFLAVADQVLQRRDGADILFIWIGSGADLSKMMSESSHPRFEGRLRFLGFREDASRLLAAADVFCLTSREDPFPLVSLEAAQYGVPTLFFKDASGISDFIRDDAGVAIPSFDTALMANAIRSYARSIRLRESHGSTARSRFIEFHTANSRLQEILSHVRLVSETAPSVSVIVPFYNQAAYVRERLESILSQTLKDIEVIVLDDCSTDTTLSVAYEYKSDLRVRYIVNPENSGNPFAQWKLGFEQALSEFVWIAEGDDFCSNNLLEELIPSFDEPETNLAFCQTEVVDHSGLPQLGALDEYFEMSDFPFSARSCLMDGLFAIEKGFGALCLIVNSSSAVFRKSSIQDCHTDMQSFRMCGDWFAYLNAIRRGKLFYSNEARNSFRRHANSVVHSIEGTRSYFLERALIANFVFRNFCISRRLEKMIIAQIDMEWYRFKKDDNESRTDFYRRQQIEVSIPSLKRKPLRVGFYVHGMLFSKGGIERIAAQLASELAWRGHQVTIFCRNWGGGLPVYHLAETVDVVGLFDEDRLMESISRLRYQIARRDLDVFIPMLSEWLFKPVIEAATDLGVKIIASEHNDPWKIEELWWDRAERLAAFSKADRLHFLLQRFVASVPEEFKPKSVVIPNGIMVRNPAAIGIASSPKGRPHRVIGVGRLEKQKRFDRLVRAFALVKAEAPTWRLDIFGEGSERRFLQNLIEELGLGASIGLHGNTSNVDSELDKSAIFVIPSEFEGFGLVIVEAKRSGLPCVGYSDCNGPNELITDGCDGFLVSQDEDGTSLAGAIRILVKDPALRERFGREGEKSVERFNIIEVADRWERLLYEVVEEANHSSVSRTAEVAGPSIVHGL